MRMTMKRLSMERLTVGTKLKYQTKMVAFSKQLQRKVRARRITKSLHQLESSRHSILLSISMRCKKWPMPLLSSSSKSTHLTHSSPTPSLNIISTIIETTRITMLICSSSHNHRRPRFTLHLLFKTLCRVGPNHSCLSLRVINNGSLLPNSSSNYLVQWRHRRALSKVVSQLLCQSSLLLLLLL